MKTGDRVVCIKSHSQCDLNGVVKGAIFTIQGMRKYACCGYIAYDIGLVSTRPFNRCVCGARHLSEEVWYIGSRLFAPLKFNSCHDELINIVEERIDIKQPEKQPV